MNIPDTRPLMLDWICPNTCRCGIGTRSECRLYQSMISSAPENRVKFDQLPIGKTAEIYGVRYAAFDTPQLGQLMVTRYGWPWFEALLPDAWYDGGRFWREGQRLDQSTGVVYRYDSKMCNGRAVPMVVKVSRFAQDVPFYASDTFLKNIPPGVLAGMRFSNPFEEFGRLIKLRESRIGPRVLTKRPLAIYSPPDKHPLWELCREASAAAVEQWDVAHQQDAQRAKIELQSDRAYFTIFGWIAGDDVSSLGRSGHLDAAEMEQITDETGNDLHQHSMVVLDHKPAHVIVRRDPISGRVRRRKNGRLVYALVDFELLVDLRTAEGREQAEQVKSAAG